MSDKPSAGDEHEPKYAHLKGSKVKKTLAKKMSTRHEGKDAYGIPLYKEPFYKAHKAVGGTLYFPTSKHPETKRHEAREKEIKSNKK